jgi:hypothetical protein
METPADIFINICDELNALSVPLTEAISLLKRSLTEIEIDHPIFLSAQRVHRQIDQTLDSIGEMYQIMWLILSYDRLRSGAH